MNEVEITKEQQQKIIIALNRFGEQMTELACVFHAKIEKLSPYIELLASLEPAAPQQKKRKKSKWHPANERLMRMVEDRFVLVGNSLDGHLQDCNCAVFLSSRMERDAWSELCYEWHGIYSDWQSANGHQAGKVSENEGSEG